MISKDDADNLLYESKENLVDMLCTQSELVDDLYIKLKAKDEEIERLKADKECAKNMMKGLVDGIIITHKVAISKARSIVAMLFWEYKKLRCASDGYFHSDEEIENAYYTFKNAYKMLKSNGDHKWFAYVNKYLIHDMDMLINARGSRYFQQIQKSNSEALDGKK